MTPPADPAAKLQPNPSARLREIPSVDELLARPQLAALAEKAGRAVVTQSSRAVLAELRNELKHELSATKPTNASDLAAALDPAAIESRIIKHVELLLAPSLVHVINATGVILHTNLGRAPLPAAAAAAIRLHRHSLFRTSNTTSNEASAASATFTPPACWRSSSARKPRLSSTTTPPPFSSS